MEGIWTRIGQVVARRTVVVLVLVLVVTAVLAGGLSRLDFATGQDSYIDKDSTEAQDNRRYQDALRRREHGRAVHRAGRRHGRRPVHPGEPRPLRAARRLSCTIRAAGSRRSSRRSPLLRWTQDLITSRRRHRILTGAIDPRARSGGGSPPPAGRCGTDVGALGGRRRAVVRQPRMAALPAVRQRRLLSSADGEVVAPAGRRARDPQTAAARSSLTRTTRRDRVRGQRHLDELATGSRSVKDAVAGQDVRGRRRDRHRHADLPHRHQRLSAGGMLTLGLIAVAVMLIVLAIAFRVRWRLLPMLAVLVGIVWGFGAVRLHRHRTCRSSRSPGCRSSSVSASSSRSRCTTGSRRSACSTATRTPSARPLARLGPPMVVATVSAVISFLVMRISRVPMIQDFGVLLSIGIVMLLVAGIVVPTPCSAPASAVGRRRRRRAGWVERILHWLGSPAVDGRRAARRVAVVIPVVGLVLERNSEIESDPINWADQSTDTVKNARRLEQRRELRDHARHLHRDERARRRTASSPTSWARSSHDFVARGSRRRTPRSSQASSLASTVS